MARAPSFVKIEVEVDDKKLVSLNKKIESVEKQLKEMSAAFSKNAKVVTRQSKSLANLNANLVKTQKKLDSTTKKVGGLGEKFRKGKAGLDKFLLPLAAGIHILGQFSQAIGAMMQQAKEVGAMGDQMEFMASKMQNFAEKFEDAQVATSGTVANRDLSETMSLMTAFGLPMERTGEIMGQVAKIAVATGQDATFMADSFARGVSRMSPLILDNLGIQLKIKDATQAWADENNRTVASMSKQEQQAAVLNETLRLLRVNTADVNLATSRAAGVKRLEVTYQNLKDELTEFIMVDGIHISTLGTSTEFLREVNDLASMVTTTLLTQRNAVADSIVGMDGLQKAMAMVVDITDEETAAIMRAIEAARILALQDKGLMDLQGEIFILTQKQREGELAVSEIRKLRGLQQEFEIMQLAKLAEAKGDAAGLAIEEIKNKRELTNILEKDVPLLQKSLKFAEDLVFIGNKQSFVDREKANALLMVKKFRKENTQAIKDHTAQSQQAVDAARNLRAALMQQFFTFNILTPSIDRATDALANFSDAASKIGGGVMKFIGRVGKGMTGKRKGRRGGGGGRREKDIGVEIQQPDVSGLKFDIEREIDLQVRRGEAIQKGLELQREEFKIREQLATGGSTAELRKQTEALEALIQKTIEVGDPTNTLAGLQALQEQFRRNTEETLKWRDAMAGLADVAGTNVAPMLDLLVVNLKHAKEASSGIVTVFSDMAKSLEAGKDGAADMVNAGIPGMQKFTKALHLEQEQEAAILGAMSAAKSVAAFATGNFVGGAGHAIAAGMFFRIAGGGVAPVHLAERRKRAKQKEKEKKEREKRKEQEKKDQGERVVNIHFSGLPLNTKDEIALAIDGMLKHGKRKGLMT